MEGDESGSWEQFLGELWADVDADRLRPLDDYQARYPALAERVAEEYLAVRKHRSAAATAAAPAADPIRGDAPSAGAPPAPAPSPSIAFRIGRYEVQRRLTGGGMGIVYLGRDPEIDRRVVLKTVRGFQTGRTPALQRLQREARIAGRIAHEGVCPVLDVITHEHEVFVVMPFIEGETLAARLRRARARAGADTDDPVLLLSLHEQSSESGVQLASAPPRSGAAELQDSARAGPPPRGDLRHVLRLTEKIAAAVDGMHEAGIVHRDLKPSNIMIRPDGEPVVLDFGLAFDESSDSTRMTQEGEALGTPLYMAAEQVEGRLSSIDRRTDVYALGVVLYELLTLRLPFEGPSKEAVFHRILKGDATPPRRLNPRLPLDLEAVCLKALSLSPAQRYATARAFAEDLRNVRTLSPTLAKPPSALGRAWRRVRRHPWASGALAACAVLLPLCLVLYVSGSHARENSEVLGQAFELSFAGHELPPALRERLVEILPDAAGRSLLLKDPRERETWREAEDELPDTTRGAEVELELIAPRASILDPRPTFEFTATIEEGARADGELLLLDGEGKKLATLPFSAQGADSPARVRLELPDSPRLEIDRAYSWRVQLRVPEPGSATGAASVGSPRVEFRIASREERERCLSVPATGDPVLDRLVRAANLVAHGFAHDAQAILDEPFPDGAGDAALSRRLYLLARAASLLGDARRFHALYAEYSERYPFASR